MSAGIDTSFDRSDRSKRRMTTLRWIGHGLLIAGFLLMMLDIRFEHRQVVGEVKIAWVPILYSLAMVFLIPLGVFLFKKGGKHLLTVCYAGALIVGALGIYLHSSGQLIARLTDVLSVWQNWGAAPETNEPFYPPILAPFSFLGLGSIGLFLTLREYGSAKID
jgi:hypothetical protein